MTAERPNETTERLWTVRDVAAFLQASTSYVYKAAERGDLPCRRLGALLRFIPSEVQGWAVGVREVNPPRRAPVGRAALRNASLTSCEKGY